MTTRRTAADIVDAVAGAAHALFLQRSPSAVSMRDIATAADVNLGLIHRYVGSKDEVISLVLDRHTQLARAAITDAVRGELVDQVADAVVRRPATGRLIAGMILDGVDVSRLKGDFPLLEQFEDDDAVGAAITYALALGWEVFGPSLLEAVDANPDPADLSAAVADAMRAVRGTRSEPLQPE